MRNTKVKCDLGLYEILDRTHVIMENINDQLVTHPRLKRNKTAKKELSAAIASLYKVYNWAGKCLD